jgi:hypothetical protein
MSFNFVVQSSLPVRESKAWKRSSDDAPMNTMPPVVAMEPPPLGVPVLGMAA